MRQRLAAGITNHTTLRASGGRVVYSSDDGVGPKKPHDVLPYGVSTFLPRIGMSDAEALTATTATAADVCEIADISGTLEPGKDADILVVAGNPLDDLAALHQVVAVFARGSRTAAPARQRGLPEANA